MSGFEIDLEGFEGDLKKTLEDSGAAFRGRYKDQINELLGLSREAIDQITPDATDLAVYDALIQVVKEASAKNLAQAELKGRILKLGSLAVQIAGRVPSLASLLGPGM